MASGIWHLACQTYALNLIDSHSGQKQAPQLFSSSKSFRVAKSTPSSAKSLAKLSPISKWLFKPPLLFKSPLLSKSALVFAPLLLLSYTQGVQALSAQTSRVIEGSAPYLTFDGGQTKATDTNNLLYIELPDGRTIMPSTNTSSSTNPIMVSAGITFNDIHMVIPSGASFTSLSSLISQGKWGDDDGDGQGAGGVTASGSISLTIKGRNGTTVNRSDTLSICNAPYKVTLDSTGGTLETRYGMPKTSRFYGGTVDYYITLPSQPVICSARPDLTWGAGVQAGPANMWNPDKGFLVQSTSPSSYNLNFPTTGLDGLYFDLDIGGIDAGQLRWTVNTSGRLGATVSRVGSNTRVTLSGPRASYSQIRSSSPSSLDVPSLPQTFELVGRDSSGNAVVKYGFVLRQWFVNRGNKFDSAPDQTAWCRNLGYRLSKIRDLTNAKCGADGRFSCVNGIDSASPNSSGNFHMRHIGAGFFTEWGYMSHYADAGFVNDRYWTSDARGITQFFVNSDSAPVGSRRDSDRNFAVCTAP